MGWDGGNGLHSVLISAIKLRQLLTGEGCVLLKIFGDSVRHRERKSYNPTPIMIKERKINEKILDLTSKIIPLLTREVPIRYEDITVTFSLEEWEFIEGHKDLYRDILMKDTHLKSIGNDNTKTLHRTSVEKIIDSRILDQDRNHIFGKIFHLTEEITHLLTKEKYILIWNPGKHTTASGTDHVSRLITESSPPLLINEQENNGKILELTNNVTELLTREVPVRCQDVTVYFSMEEWEYIEGHKDLYWDIIRDNDIFKSSNKSSSLDFTFEKPLDCLKHGKASSQSSGVLTHNPPKQLMEPITSCPNQSNLENYKKYHKKQTAFPCCRCGIPLKRSDVGQMETDTAASNRSKKFCRKCLRCRRRKNTKKKPFACIECGSCFSRKSSLDIHLRIHTLSKIFQCSECDKVFTNGTILETHMRVHTGEKPYKCSECGKYFSNTGNLQAHYRTHTGEKPFSCSECDKSFRYKSHLVAHQRFHTGQTLPCSECGRRFVYRSHLVKHLRIHTGEKPYKCPECGKSFHRSAHLTQHMMSHTGESPFKCEECDKCFRFPSDLFRHQKTHTGEKPFSCSECGKGFTRSTSLAEHAMIHTGEKPYSCPQCGKLFVKNNYMLKHLKTHKKSSS